MAFYKCKFCGVGFFVGNPEDGVSVETHYCDYCDPHRYHRDREGGAEASEAATERARADYYHNYSNLLKELNDSYRDFLLKVYPQKINDITPREWDLGRQVYLLQQDNEALRSLCEEYRKTLEEYAAKIN